MPRGHRPARRAQRRTQSPIRVLLTPCHRTPPRSGEVLRRPIESAICTPVLMRRRRGRAWVRSVSLDRAPLAIRERGGPERPAALVDGVVRVANSQQGCEGRVPCAVSDLVCVGTANDGTTGGADRDAVAQQIGRGTGR